MSGRVIIINAFLSGNNLVLSNNNVSEVDTLPAGRVWCLSYDQCLNCKNLARGGVELFDGLRDRTKL